MDTIQFKVKKHNPKLTILTIVYSWAHWKKISNYEELLCPHFRRCLLNQSQIRYIQTYTKKCFLRKVQKRT